MSELRKRIDQLEKRLELLLEQQNRFQQEIVGMGEELQILKSQTDSPSMDDSMGAHAIEPKTLQEQPVLEDTPPVLETKEKEEKPLSTHKKSLERAIGEKWVSVIGVLITVIGVAVGIKYAIQHQYITPVVRIVLGYLLGFGLLGTALRLRKKWLHYSAVLLSGALAIIYLISFLAYTLYGLYPQWLVFGIMLALTAATVVAAISYNQQVIAHIGLVGAYAIPFLVGGALSNIESLLPYMTIINVGILAISLKKYWKSVYYTSFGITWFILFVFTLFWFRHTMHFPVVFIYSIVFFAIFYATFVLFKFLRSEKFGAADIVLLLINSFIFYAIGYMQFYDLSRAHDNIIVFTIGNVLVHAFISLATRIRKHSDKNLFYFTLGLSLTFITILIPILLEGAWIPMLWLAEAAVLFWIGRTSGEAFYERIALPLVLIGFIGVLIVIQNSYSTWQFLVDSQKFTPILNVNFISSAISIGLLAFIWWVNSTKEYTSTDGKAKPMVNFIWHALPIASLISIYILFRYEIVIYFKQLYSHSQIAVYMEGNSDPNYIFNFAILKFKNVWLYIYTLCFLGSLNVLSTRISKRTTAIRILTWVNLLVVMLFLFQGLLFLSNLRDIKLQWTSENYFAATPMYVGIRYIAFAAVAFLLWSWSFSFRKAQPGVGYQISLDLFLHLAIVWIISSELIHCMHIWGGHPYKMGLSILWGAYSFLLIVLGLWRKRKHLRIAAFSLFGITLFKLFFYDIVHLDALSKTILLISLGILLLAISFLYNKYKHLVGE